MSGAEDGFLGRWSRLKRGVEVEPEVEPEPETPPAPVEDEGTDEEILERLGLPNPETLEPGDDVSRFMQDAVPARIRRLALRRLWAMNPVLANVDGLVDYGEDFTDAAMVVENMQTLYQVGKGMFREPAPDPELEPGDPVDPPEAEEDAPDAEADPVDDTAEPEPAIALESPAETPADAEPDPAPEEPVLATSRRMRFDFER